MKRTFQFLAERSGVIALLAILSTALPVRFLADLRIDNSIENWVSQSSPEYRLYRDFVERYGSDEFVVIGVDVPEPLGDMALERQRELGRRLRGVQGVDGVWDLPSVSGALWHGAEGWKQMAARSEFLRHSVLGTDSHTVGFFVWLKPLSGPDARRRLMDAIDAVLGEFRAPDFQIHLAGAPRMNVALDRASEHDSRVFLPAALGICVLSMLWMLRGVRSAIGPLVAVSVSAAWTVGLMTMTGHTLNAVTIVMPTLHFVLGLSNGIRLVSRYQINLAQLKDPQVAIVATMEQLFLPLLFMTVTMVVGFLALLTSDLAPIRELGLFSGIGLIVAFLSNQLIVPGILLWFSAKNSSTAVAARAHWSAQLAMVSARHARLVICAGAGLVLLCALTLPRIETESNVLNFFPPDSEVQMDYEFIGRRLTGYYTVELEAQADESKGYALIEGLKALEKEALDIPGVVRTDHIGKMELIREALARGPPASEEQESSPFAGLAERFYYENEGRVAMRFCVLVNTMRSSEFYPLLARLNASAQKRLPPQTSIQITGIVALLNQAQSALVETQVRSFTSAFVLILVMIGVLFGSFRAVLVAILPNLLPVLLTFAWMALRHIPLDSATVMTASVGIGIAVDNTIYFLARYREELRHGADSISALRATFETIGQPILHTSWVAAAGFAVLALAGFQPIASFGILTALTMLFALGTTLLLVPACVRVVRLWERTEKPCASLSTIH